MRLQSFVYIISRGCVGRNKWRGNWLKGKLGSVAEDVRL